MSQEEMVREKSHAIVRREKGAQKRLVHFSVNKHQAVDVVVALGRFE